MENDIWDEWQVGAAVGVLRTVGQLIIDRFRLEEVKICHRNLAVEFITTRKHIIKFIEYVNGLEYRIM